MILYTVYLFDDLSERYDSWFDGAGKSVFKTELLAFSSILHTLPRPWLEVGVGSGRFAQALEIEVGIDPSERLLRKAKERGVTVVKGVAEWLPFKDACFGTVFLIVTLCFLHNPEVVFKQIYRVLKDRGQVAIGFIPSDSPWGRLYKERGDQGHAFYSHAKFYNARQVETLLSKQTFKLKKYKSTLFQGPVAGGPVESPLERYVPGGGFILAVAGKE